MVRMCEKTNTGGLNMFHATSLTLNSDLDQDIDFWFTSICLNPDKKK